MLNIQNENYNYLGCGKEIRRGRELLCPEFFFNLIATYN